MLEFKEAQKVLNYYGFTSNSIEPILIEKGNEIGIFTTFKTKYGHLSRFIKFTNREELESFLKEYLSYYKTIDDEDTIVEFDNYETISPKVTFKFKPEEIDEEFVEPEIDTTFQDNLALLDIIFNRIDEAIDEIDINQTNLQDIVKEYLNKLDKYNKKIGYEKKNNVKLDIPQIDAYKKRLRILKSDVKTAEENEFNKYYDETIELYEQVLSDKVYINNLYLAECYKNESNTVDEISKLYDEFEEVSINRERRLFKKKNKTTFDDYLKENFVKNEIISEMDFKEQKKSEIAEKLAEFKNSSIEELKKRYNIIKPEMDQEIIEDLDDYFDKANLFSYYDSLTNEDKIKLLLVSSPLKELINIIVNINEKDKVTTIINEKKFLKRFEDIYNILSNEDNYATTRKCFRNLEMDSIEEFVSSIVKYSNLMDIKPLILNADNMIRFKMGILMNKGYVNASLEKDYPVNNKGLNDYYDVNLKVDLPIYYSETLLTLKVDNILKLSKNSDMITFDISNYKIVKKDEVKVINYALKNKKDFIQFNEKTYISCDLENGDYNE